MGSHKMSNDEYIAKLQEKNISIVPLESYNGTNNGILHECHCGLKRKMVPKKVLMGGNKCKCIVKNHDIYLQMISLKNIKVKPLEDYIKGHTKILHKCYCGNEWEVSPSTILCNKNHGCGCRVLGRSIEHYRNKKTILYYIKVDNLWKIGIKLYDLKHKNIEDNLLKGRFGTKEYSKYDIEIVKTKIYDKGEEAFYAEQQILEDFNKFKYSGKDMKSFGGHTELFSCDISKI